MIIHSIVKETFLSLLFSYFYYRKILKWHLKNCFRIKGKQRIIMPKKAEYATFKNYERKKKSLFMIYADF